jgi:hypothetical protein
MRLNNLLCVVAYRVPLKRVDHAAVARFVQMVTRMARGTDLALDPEHPSKWAEQVRDFAGSPVPEAVERTAWQRTKGGYGPRDVWDLCTALAAPRQFASPQDRDAYAFALFSVAGLLPTAARALLEGREGAEVGGALKDALRAQVKESRPSVDSDSARGFASFCRRVENPVQADLRVYLECLRLSLTIPNEQVWKGVAAHFEAYAKVGPLRFRDEAGLVGAMAAHPDKLKAYMALCRKEDHVQVAVNNTTTSIRLGIGQAPSTSSVRRILQCSTGAAPQTPTAWSPTGVIAAALREAEFAWEHGGS